MKQNPYLPGSANKEHMVNQLSLEKDLEKIIGKIWFVKNNFKNITQNPLLIRRAKLVQGAIRLMADYIPEKEDFANRLVLDNYLGSIQHYLTGYDLSSIHLSSKSLEIAFLFRIRSPAKNQRCNTFGALCDISVDRGLIRQREVIARAWNVVNRRNMTMHDAISEQAILWMSKEWLQSKFDEVPVEYRRLAEPMLKPLISILQERLELFSSLPDLKWYVNRRSFELTKELMIDFLEETIGRAVFPIESIEGKDIKTLLTRVSKIPEMIKNMKRTFLYELDFWEYSARQNIEDVKTVLNELYDSTLFRFHVLKR